MKAEEEPKIVVVRINIKKKLLEKIIIYLTHKYIIMELVIGIMMTVTL